MRIFKTVLTILALQVGALYGRGAETNTAPVAVSDAATTSEDVAVGMDPRVNDSDVDGNPLTLTAATTTNGTVVIVGGTNLVYTPGTNFNGTAVINYTISDGQGGTASATVSAEPMRNRDIVQTSRRAGRQSKECTRCHIPTPGGESRLFSR